GPGSSLASPQPPAELTQYLEATVQQLALSTEAGDKVLLLMRELAAMKQAQAQLQASLAAAEKRGDAAILLSQSLKSSLQAMEQRHSAQPQAPSAGIYSSGVRVGQAGSALAVSGSGAGQEVGQQPVRGTPIPSPQQELARLSAQLAVALRGAHGADNQLAALKQTVRERELDIQELQAQAAAHELVLQQVRDENAAALMAQRQTLDAAHDDERALFSREINELQSRLSSMRQLAIRDRQDADERLAAVHQSVSGEVDAAMARSLESTVPIGQLHHAQAKAARSEREASRLEREVALLQEALSKAQAQVAELLDVKEVTAAAVGELETTLARIEAAAQATRSAGVEAETRSQAMASGRRNKSREDAALHPARAVASATLDNLAREIVRAKMAEAEAVRKLRAIARAEVELRQRLLQRDGRISELKAALSGADAGPGGPVFNTRGRTAVSAALEVMARARSPSPPHPAPAPSATSVGQAVARSKRAASAPRVRNSTCTLPTVSPDGTSNVKSGSATVAELQVQVQAWEADYHHLSSLVSTLRMELAGREAEVQRLEAELAMAVSRQHQPGSPPGPSAHVHERLRTQLSAANAQLASAYSTAGSLLRKLAGTKAAGGLVPFAGFSAATTQPGQVPDTNELPAAVAARLSQLERAIAALLATPRLPASPHSLGQGSSGGGPAASSGTGAGAAQQQRTQSLQAALQAAWHERDQLAAQLDEAQAAAQQLPSPSCPRPATLLGTNGLCLSGLHGQGAAGEEGEGRERRLGVSRAGQLLSLLLRNVSSLHTACSDLQRQAEEKDALSIKVHMQAGLEQILSEIVGMEATLSALGVELPPTRPAGQPARSKQTASQQGLASSRALHSRQPGQAQAGSDQPGLWQGVQGRSGEDSPQAVGEAEEEEEELEEVQSSGSHSSFAFQPALDRTARTPHLQACPPPPSQYSSQPGKAGKGPAAGQPDASDPRLIALTGNNVLAGAGFSATASGTLDGALGDDMGGPSPDISAKLADRLMEQRGMTEKWKRRARQLGQQLALMSAGLAAQEAAAAERAAAGDRELEEQVVHFRAHVLRLQAELAGSEAARQQLEQPAAHDSLGQQSTGAAHLARTAELEARCLVLARQLDQEQVQAAGAGAALQEQVARLKASLAQEQGERARLLGSMREALAGLRGAGDGEGRLRSQLLDAHQCAASAQTAQAQAEACATGWREECNMLRQKLVMSEKGRVELSQHMEARLLMLERRCARLSDHLNAQLDSLAHRVLSLAASPSASLAQEDHVARMEEDIGRLSQQLAAALANAEGRTASKWSCLATVTRYQRAIKLAVQEAAELRELHEATQRGAVDQRAVLEVALADVTRRLEESAAQLRLTQERAAQAAQLMDSERQEMRENHLSHITELLSRNEHERQAMAVEARTRDQALAAIREGQASAAVSAAVLAAVESRYQAQLTSCEAQVQALQQQLQKQQAAFRRYQEQKTVEVAELESRVLCLINKGHGAADEPARQQQAMAQQQDMGSSCWCPNPGCIGQNRAQKVTCKGAACGPGMTQQGCASGVVLRGVNRHPKPGRASGGLLRRGLPLNKLTRCTHQSWGGYNCIERDDWSNTRDQEQPADRVASTIYAPHLAADIDCPAAEVAEAVAEDLAAAARREVYFERVQRQRAESNLLQARKAIATLKARLRLVHRQTAAVQRSSVPAKDYEHMLQELQCCRASLKACRIESNRRQHALLMLQSVVQSQHPSVKLGGATASSARPALVAEVSFDSHIWSASQEAELQHLAAAADTADQATTLAADEHDCDFPGNTSPPSPQPLNPRNRCNARATRLVRPTIPTSLAALGPQPGHSCQEGGAWGNAGGQLPEPDPLAAAAATAAAAAASTHAALNAEQALRQELEGKLKEARTALGRKNTLLGELRRRQEALEVELAELQGTGMAAALATAESQVRSVAANLVRKDALIKAQREKLEAMQAAQQSNSQQEAMGRVEEVERLSRTATRLKAEVVRKEAALATLTSECDKLKQLLASASASVEDASRREAAQHRASLSNDLSAMTTRCAALLAALRQLLHLVFKSTQVVRRAANRNSQGQAVASSDHPPSFSLASPTFQVAAVSPADRATAAAAVAVGLSAADVVSLTGLPLIVVQQLMGNDMSAKGQGGESRHGGRGLPLPSTVSGVSASYPPKEQQQPMLAMLEATLLPPLPSANKPLSVQQLMGWDPSVLQVLVQQAEQEVAAVEGSPVAVD
ncbi:hypothetical protein QJQ45_015508, partial [Haematococcus lacustris]